MLNISPDFQSSFSDFPDDVEYYLSNYFGLKFNRPAMYLAERTWRPNTDMFETEDEITAVMEVAGISEQDVRIKLDRDYLIVTGIRKDTYGHLKKRQYHKMEIDYGPFEVIIKLPAWVAAETAKAFFKDGFLVISIKKGTEPPSCLEIDIQ